jgi:hypothetical protein
MAYKDFAVPDLGRQFGLRFVDGPELFASVPPVEVSPMLTWYLDENAPLALPMSTEKARSEMIIAPVFLEARRMQKDRVSLFSGPEFSVDAARGLNGYCDFLFSLSRTQIEIEAPVIAIVEADENLRGGIPQCVAELYAARVFNERAGHAAPVVYGAVTSGSDWRFLRVSEGLVEVDRTEYYLREVGRIVGVLVHMLTLAQAPAAAT